MISRATYIAVVERCLLLEAGTPAARYVPLVRRRISPAIDAQIRALWAAGVARKDIAEELQVAYNAVYVRTKEQRDGSS